jgi:hypothetical protein
MIIGNSYADSSSCKAQRRESEDFLNAYQEFMQDELSDIQFPPREKC